MRLRFLFLPLLCALVAVIGTPSRSRNGQSSQRAIDDFMRTRGSDFEPRRKQAGKPSKPRVNPTGRTGGSVTERTNGNAPPASDPESNGGEGMIPIGLGYTVFRYKSDSELAAVAPDTVFKTGDQLLLALETNADGYLYIFNSENDGKPEMRYPNVALDRGRNSVSAHTRERYPADSEQTFTIEGKPATERLHIIFSRKPLPDVPTGEELMKLCKAGSDDCDWRPTSAQWERITWLASGTKVVESKNTELARVGTAVRSSSLTRSIKVRPKDHIPAVVRMSASTSSDMLLTTIDLMHK